MSTTGCLIVKDEIDHLGDCLAALRPCVDQLVIVDTGSTDGTAALARAEADVFASFPFRGDFSAARNAAIERADGDWIIFLDADERFPADQHQPLLDHVAAAPSDVL